MFYSFFKQTLKSLAIKMALVLVFVLQFNESETLPLTTTFLDTSLSMKTDARLHVRLLIRNIVNRPKVWNHIAKQTDLRLVESIRKRKKRQREVIYIPPSNRRLVRLQSETGFFLEILPSGKVGGSVNKTEFTLVELQTITPNIKRIKGVKAEKYLAINKKGKVIAKVQDVSDHETFFYEEFTENYHHLYSSIKYPKADSGLSWYLGLKRKHGKRTLQGRTKRASRTLPGETATHFSILNESKR